MRIVFTAQWVRSHMIARVRHPHVPSKDLLSVHMEYIILVFLSTYPLLIWEDCWTGGGVNKKVFMWSNPRSSRRATGLYSICEEADTRYIYRNICVVVLLLRKFAEKRRYSVKDVGPEWYDTSQPKVLYNWEPIVPLNGSTNPWNTAKMRRNVLSLCLRLSLLFRNVDAALCPFACMSLWCLVSQ